MRDNVEYICQLLISHGADLTCVTSSDKDSPVHYFANYGFCDLAAKCPIETFSLENKNGWTCLHFASESGQYHMIEYILNQLPSLRKRRTNDKLLPVDLTKHHFPRCKSLLDSFDQKSKSVRFAESVKTETEVENVSLLLLNWRQLPQSVLIPKLEALLSRQTSEIKQLRDQINDQEQQIQTFLQTSV